MSIVSDVRILVDEASPVFWPDQQVYDAVNEIQLHEQLIPGMEVAEATLTVSPEDEFVDLPAAVMIPLEIIAVSDSEPCWLTTQAKLEQHSHEWKKADTGVPRWFVLWDFFHLRPYPRAAESYTYTLRYVPYPATEIAVGAESLPATTPDLLQDAIAHRAAARLLIATMPQFAVAQAEHAEELETRYRRRVRNQQSHRIWRLRPGGRVARAEGGVIKSGQWFV